MPWGVLDDEDEYWNSFDRYDEDEYEDEYDSDDGCTCGECVGF